MDLNTLSEEEEEGQLFFVCLCFTRPFGFSTEHIKLFSELWGSTEYLEIFLLPCHNLNINDDHLRNSALKYDTFLENTNIASLCSFFTNI